MLVPRYLRLSNIVFSLMAHTHTTDPYIGISRIFFRMSDASAAAAAHESLGQGNHSSLQSRTLSARRLSIVDRLAARSLTGRGLNIHVHQHFGYRLHLEWGGDPNNTHSARFMESSDEDLRSINDKTVSLNLKYLGTNTATISYILELE